MGSSTLSTCLKTEIIGKLKKELSVWALARGPFHIQIFLFINIYNCLFIPSLNEQLNLTPIRISWHVPINFVT